MFYRFSDLCENRYETSKIKAFVLGPPEPPCPQSCTSGAGQWVPCHSPVTTPSEPPLQAPRDTALELLPTSHSNAPGWTLHGTLSSRPGWRGRLHADDTLEWTVVPILEWKLGRQILYKESAKETFPVDERVHDMKLQKKSV